MTGRVEVIGDCTLYLGDCRDILPTLGQVDSVIMDPPYGVGLTAKQNKWVARGGDGYATTDDTPEFVATVVVAAVAQCQALARSVVVTPGTRNTFAYPAPDAIGGIYNRNGAGSGKWGFECMAPVLFYGKDPYLAGGLGRRPNSWEQPGTDFAEKSAHPCPKPLGLVNWLVTRCSLPGETVLDPFMGSGTTGVACAQLGRRFVGVEIDQGYFDIACSRIAQAQKQPRLFAEPAPKAVQEALDL